MSLLDHPQISQICWQTTWNHQSGLYIATSVHSKPPTDQWPIKITTEPWVCLDFGGQEEVNKSFNFLSTALIDLNDRLDHFVHFSTCFSRHQVKWITASLSCHRVPELSSTGCSNLSRNFCSCGHVKWLFGLHNIQLPAATCWGPKQLSLYYWFQGGRPRNAINQEDTYMTRQFGMEHDLGLQYFTHTHTYIYIYTLVKSKKYTYRCICSRVNDMSPILTGLG